MQAVAHPEIRVAQILPRSHAKVKQAVRGATVSFRRDIALMEHFGLNISPSHHFRPSRTSNQRRAPTSRFQSHKALPRQAALWPKTFCMDFARTFGPSKSQP